MEEEEGRKDDDIEAKTKHCMNVYKKLTANFIHRKARVSDPLHLTRRGFVFLIASSSRSTAVTRRRADSAYHLHRRRHYDIISGQSQVVYVPTTLRISA